MWLCLQLLAVVIILGPSGWRTPTWWAGLLMVAGLGGLLWALRYNRPSNFRLSPQPQADGELVTAGPYAWTRHPMYVALLLMTAGVCGVRESWVAVLAWLALALVLDQKAKLEETLLLDAFPDYEDYCRRVRRWCPILK